MLYKKYYFTGLLVLFLSVFIYGNSRFRPVDVCNNVFLTKKDIVQNVFSSNLLPQFPPDPNNLPLSLIQPIGYHGDEVPADFDLKKWIGIFKDENGYYLDSTRITIQTCYDPIMDEEENDSLSWTGKYIQALHLDSCIYLISGLNDRSSIGKDIYLKNILDSVQYIYPPDTINIKFLEQKYSLYGRADSAPSEYSPEELIYTNYRLFFTGTNDKQQQITQALATAASFDSNMFSLLFVGDIDNDGLLDFIVNTSEHYNVYQPTLYLSSFANKGELVGLAAIHRSVGC